MTYKSLLRVASAAALVATGLLSAGSACAADADGCDTWSKFARMVATMRDSGTSEDVANKFIAHGLPDDQELQVATTLSHRIYTEPTLRAMDPDRVARAFKAACEQK